MRKNLLFFLILVLSISLSAQIQQGLRGDCDVSSYPTVSFVWHSTNPEELKSSQFAVLEGDSTVSFEVTPLLHDNSKGIRKNILILWEDMASHSRQSDFTRDLLIRFFRETELSPNDCFEVAVFDRNKDGKEFLERQVGDFTSDSGLLSNSLIAYEKNKRLYGESPKCSDLYCAVKEGVALLKKEVSDGAGVIVVITAGLNTNFSGTCSLETASQIASEAGIPVYVVKYPLAGETPGVNALAERTFGLVISSLDGSESLSGLQGMYHVMDKRLRGHDYKISFMTKNERDGKQHDFQFWENGNSEKLSFVAPRATFGMWLKKNWWVVVLSVLLVSGIAVLVVFLVKKNHEKNEQAAQTMQDQMRREQEERERRNREAMETLRREQQAKEYAAKEAAQREKEAAEEERLCKLMQTKNLYPRLKCRCGSESLNVTIAKPRITLGRDADNDVSFNMENKSFNNQTVSGRHAEIVFNGYAFEIVNKSHSYTKGVIVNGRLYQHCTLRNGDMIGLGEAIITFYV